MTRYEDYRQMEELAETLIEMRRTHGGYGTPAIPPKVKALRRIIDKAQRYDALVDQDAALADQGRIREGSD